MLVIFWTSMFASRGHFSAAWRTTFMIFFLLCLLRTHFLNLFVYFALILEGIFILSHFRECGSGVSIKWYYWSFLPFSSHYSCRNSLPEGSFDFAEQIHLSSVTFSVTGKKEIRETKLLTFLPLSRLDSRNSEKWTKDYVSPTRYLALVWKNKKEVKKWSGVLLRQGNSTWRLKELGAKWSSREPFPQHS